jgi:hypothetical protein
MKPRAASSILVMMALTGCLKSMVVSQPMTDMDRTRATAGAQEGEKLAPQEFRHAEDLRAAAVEAQAKRDPAGADLLAERALVAYQRSLVLARIAHATTALEAAQASLDKQVLEAERLAAARVPFDQQADATAAALAVAREALTPAKSGPVDPAREKARVIAARSLAAEGHLLCSAARLLSPTAAGLDAAVRDADAIETDLAAPLRREGRGQVPAIDGAARARAGCLAILTRARRGDGPERPDDADALLSELSAHGGWDPARDERGVVVTLRGAYRGNALTPEADRELHDLGRVAASHGGLPVQVVLHDASPPSDAERAGDTQRVGTALASLTAGGAVASLASAETPGARLPIADPLDPTSRARNARLDVVFISRN